MSWLLSVVVAIVSVLVATSVGHGAATISYSGRVFAESGAPLVGGFVIAGTFAPTFDPFGYNCFYGDHACNLDPMAYPRAVADGNFFPAGSGGLTDTSGYFSVSGLTNAQDGTRIWLFAFQDASTTTFTQALATSSAPNWLVPGGSGGTTLGATEATTFVLGMDHPDGIQLFVIPYPEPGHAMSLLFIASIGIARRRRP